jgi:RNA polymerase sigma-70 factor (ECF subfamily)
MMMTPTQKTTRQAVLSSAHADFEKVLNSYAAFKVSDKAIGEDLVQDTFVKTWSYLARGGKIHVMKSFLYHVLNNLIVDEYRKRKTTSLDVLLEKGYEPSFDNSKSLFDLLDGKSALLLIQRLPLTYRKAMRMRYVQDLTLKEMSLVTGQSKNTLAVQLHRGTQKLKLLYDVA